MELHRAFRPEFLNRLDETIMFRPLTRENLNGIIDIMVEGLRKRLADPVQFQTGILDRVLRIFSPGQHLPCRTQHVRRIQFDHPFQIVCAVIRSHAVIAFPNVVPSAFARLKSNFPVKYVNSHLYRRNCIAFFRQSTGFS